ncbi:MAG: RluA family pseudouridine synthase [Phycisphaerae bacterium]|nr:RluA family pseudouridine synthase [Phycisphaerae bacterium]
MPSLTIAPNDRVPITIRYQDDDLLVADKPAGVPTQPGLGHLDDTLLNGLFARFGPRLQNLGRHRDFGLLHRLDRPTSGLVIVGLRVPAYDALRLAFERRAVKKFYWAVVSPPPSRDSGVIRRPILEQTRDRKTASISPKGKPAITAFRVLARAPRDAAALVECRPVTGRLHQVRVHLASIHAPILGDPDYGTPARHRLALHAHRIILPHPTTGAPLDVRAPLPRDLAALLKKLGIPRPSEPSDEPPPALETGDPLTP